MNNQFWTVLFCFMCSAVVIITIGIFTNDLKENGDKFITAVIFLIGIWLVLSYVFYSIGIISVTTASWL